MAESGAVAGKRLHGDCHLAAGLDSLPPSLLSRAAISLKKGPALHHPKLPGVRVWRPSGEDGGDQPQAGIEQKARLEREIDVPPKYTRWLKKNDTGWARHLCPL